MGILVKGAFWFSAVLLTLPIIDTSSEETGADTAPKIEMTQTLSALAVAVADIKAICERHPDVCETGGETLTALGHRARDGARIAYEYLDASLADGEPVETAAEGTEPTDPVATGTVAGLSVEEAIVLGETLVAAHEQTVAAAASANASVAENAQ
ncbi:DUF5330 domain-containing protein [Pararhizobium haloflavum]|uniref:DUF5330 domain-containing protein n=1 Tax=Pararhizobium haloflavum TaxID=2037914 RepID=UPI0012FFFCE0|nr:DUF5330 domain-containing protein [Pararhizobium haloflavum]